MSISSYDAALSVADQRLQRILERAPAAIAVLDRDLRYVAASERFFSDFGLTRTSTIGRRYPEVFANPPERWMAMYARCLAGATERVDDELVTRPDGRTDWMCWEVAPWHESTGDIGGVVQVSEITTERKRLQDQLRQAQKMEAIGRLAGGIAHDFNNMLTAIIGYSEMLTEQIDADKPLGRDLREILAAARRAATLTQQLLAFSRKQALTITATDLSDVVAGIQKLLRRLIGARITVRTQLADDLYAVMADVTQIEHALVNLAVNARDAMAQGGTLTIATENVDLDETFVASHPGAKPGLYASLSVSDTGSGIPPELGNRIFEPFFTTKEHGRGTGLGLAAVYGIVKQLDGYIAVESVVGKGTTFRIYLPKTERIARAPHAPVAVATTAVGHETILLVEDEHGVRRFIASALTRFGYRIIEAEDAESALTSLQTWSGTLDLLLTDVVLPGMSGPELAHRVLEARPGVRVLYMSGYTERYLTVNDTLDPSVELIEKPFTAHHLIARTRQVLGGEKPAS
jgi:PAS domain S-box-containing protein